LAAARWAVNTRPAELHTGSGPPFSCASCCLSASLTEQVVGIESAPFTPGKSVTGAAVAATVGRNAPTRSPTASLAPGTRYTAMLSSLIKDADGKRITMTTWRFTTRL